jgi:uncharacterized protein
MKNPVVHFEMPAEDTKRMSEFYSRVFGWKTTQLGEEMGNYVLVTTTDTDENGMIKTPGNINGGFFPKSADGPQHPSVVISVEDIHDAIKNIRDGGGKVQGEPQEIPGIGTYVLFTDTEGNQVGVLQPVMEMQKTTP